MITPEDILQLVDSTELSVPATGLQIDSPLVAQGLDSLDIATLMVEVESTYKIVIPSEQMANRWSVQDIVDFLNRACPAGTEAAPWAPHSPS